MISKINDFIDGSKDSIISDLQKVIRIPSYNQPPKDDMPYGENVSKCLNKFLNIANNMGFKTKNFDNYVGTIEYGGDHKLGILCHLDVVPEGTGWTYEPYGATVKDGKIYGRGSIDNKGPAIAVLYAMKAIKELNISLKNGVRFIVGCDEECGSSDLTYYKTKESFPPMVFTPDGCYPVINTEKGQCRVNFGADIKENNSDKKIISIYGGHTINAIPANCTAKIKGIDKNEVKTAIENLDIDVKFEIIEDNDNITINATGKGSHASTPTQGINAVSGMIKLLSNLPFSESESFNFIKSINKLLPYGDCQGKNIGVNFSDETSGELTLAFSIFSLCDKSLSGSIDIRFPVCTSLEELTQILTTNFNKYNINKVCINGVKPHQTPADSNFVKSLLKVYEEQTGLKGECISIGGGTYVHDIEGGVAFGAEFPQDDHNMHGADEFIEIDLLLKNAKIFAHSIVELLG